MSTDKPVKLAILWHMHQPNYIIPNTNSFAMPWVRFHGLKDYLDMPKMVSQFENVKVTFNLVPSLIDQIELYEKGYNDPHLDLSEIKAELLSESQKREILTTFFNVPEKTMIKPYHKFRKMHRKVKDNINQSILASLFSSDEIRDIQIWSNLVWIDPIFRNDEKIKYLYDKGEHFTEDDKHVLLSWQKEFLKKIIPTYRDLFSQKKIDVSFTPYYHPILPLLCDTESALEALPKLKLPENRFKYPEDARAQIEMSVKKFESIFGEPLKGMWPSEGSISEETAEIAYQAGIKWLGGDEQVLYHSLRKSNIEIKGDLFPTVYQYKNGMKFLFRNHFISDRIGFVYSSMEPEDAARDFINNILKIREKNLSRIEQTVIPIILDGENAWEYFPNDGYDFLTGLYKRLDEEPLIQTVTFSEAVDMIPAQKLNSIFAGSWINHNFKVWIGHKEDNQAWDLLYKVRKTLTEFEQQNQDFDKTAIQNAWKQIYIAEGSDWCWWYGDEHRNPSNTQFDILYRKHLASVYEFLNLEIPEELSIPIFKDIEELHIIEPEILLSPKIDGRISHFYEWSGAGCLDIRNSGSTMHLSEKNISKIYHAYDHTNIYFRLDFVDSPKISEYQKPKLRLSFNNSLLKNVDFELLKGKIIDKEDNYTFAFDELIEIALNRDKILKDGFGDFSISFTLYDGENIIELAPEKDPMTVKIPERDKELFWPT